MTKPLPPLTKNAKKVKAIFDLIENAKKIEAVRKTLKRKYKFKIYDNDK